MFGIGRAKTFGRMREASFRKTRAVESSTEWDAAWYLRLSQRFSRLPHARKLFRGRALMTSR
jgi:hypothetical protein